MKLRIRGNTIRLRVTQSEINQLAEVGFVESSISFSPNPVDRIGYAIQSSSKVSGIHAIFENNIIQVQIPKDLTEKWTQSDLVGLSQEQDLGGMGILKILIEKDFACLKPRIDGEDESDNFPNPNQNCC